MLFFIYFFCKWAETFEKLQFFCFGPKQCFYLTHSAWEYFESCHLRATKNTNLNGCIWKATTNSDSKATFSERWTLYQCGYTACDSAPSNLQCLQKLMMRHKKFEFVNSYLLLWRMRRNFRKTPICLFWIEAMFLLNPIILRILWKINT